MNIEVCSKMLFITTLVVTLTFVNSIKVSRNADNWEDAQSIYEFNANSLDGENVSLEKYRGHVCIIVNVASECGFTENHYKELVEMDEKYKDTKGLRILAFPSNSFSQEPGDSATIEAFAKSKNVKFDMFEKIEVNGDNAHPLWKYLKHKQGGIFGDFIKWNFTKFIIDKNGQPVERYAPTTSPKELIPELEKLW